jgi:N-acyl-D-amino-acid deacylase
MKFLAVLLTALVLRAETFDLVIRHGRVIDGAGNPAFFADVGIKDGRITAIGRVEGTAREEINATNKVVTPGFIDVHTHAEDIDDLPLAENFLRMGVTTLVLGNCGSSTLDVDKYFRRLEATNISANVCTLIGHGTVREKAMGGSFDRAPTAEELAAMEALVRRAMEDGAVGISTGLIYLPGTFSKTDEIIALARVASAHGGIYASHMRGEGLEIFDSLNEVFRIAREAKMRAQVSHLKLSGRSAWGQPDKVLAAIEAARAEGLDITQDQYVYTASSTAIAQLVPQSWREGSRFKERIADPARRAKLAGEMKANLKRGGRTNYSYAVIASYRHDRSLNGLNIAEAAKKNFGDDSLDRQIDMVLEILSNGGASGIFHGISEDDLRVFLQHPNTMFASDSGVRRHRSGVPHPRGYGNNARVLGHYVRELKLIRLEDAVRRMTSLPAATFQLTDRGQLRPGAWADVAVFDPATVKENTAFADPHHYATGFAAVLVNGKIVIRDDKHLGARPGRTLRANR